MNKRSGEAEGGKGQAQGGGTAVRQPGGVPTAAHQQAHAPAIPEQRGIEIPFDIPQDLLQRIRPARVHPQ